MNQLNELILTRLRETYPNKRWEYHLEIDPVSYNPRNFLACDGKRTPFGYDINLMTDLITKKSHTVQALAENIFNQVKFSIDGKLTTL